MWTRSGVRPGRRLLKDVLVSKALSGPAAQWRRHDYGNRLASSAETLPPAAERRFLPYAQITAPRWCRLSALAMPQADLTGTTAPRRRSPAACRVSQRHRCMQRRGAARYPISRRTSSTNRSGGTGLSKKACTGRYSYGP